MTMSIAFESPLSAGTSAPLAAARPVARLRMRNAFAYALIGLLLWTGVASAADPGAARAPIDLNRASAEELETLPGIGASKAAAIVEAREAQGGFASLEDLEAVRGIGPALMAKLRPLVVVGGAGGKAAAAKAGAPPTTK
jgi:competence protein ComEA